VADLAQCLVRLLSRSFSAHINSGALIWSVRKACSALQAHEARWHWAAVDVTQSQMPESQDTLTSTERQLHVKDNVVADLHKLLAENDQRLSSEMHSLAGEASKARTLLRGRPAG